MIYDQQSGMAAVPFDINESSNVIVSETTEFHDQATNWVYDEGCECDPSFNTTGNSSDSLAKFLQRPVLVHTADWATTNPSFNSSFNPWTAFFGNTVIQNKVNHYNNIRCKLHLKFMINGNAFMYGRAVAAYTPLHQDTSYPNLVLPIPNTLTRATSRPHIFLDPTASQGGEMVLPYFHWQSNLSLPKAETDQLGFIDIMAINQLKHANGAVEAVRITVFAWAEDVSLSVPTNRSYGTQSGSDEYTGSISKMASTAANLARTLSSIPTLYPYARASEMMLRGVGSMAALFGYSRPVVTDMQHFKPHYVGNMANTNVHDNSNKLATDIKQETTIDPRTVGLGSTDEMTIQSIVSRSAYIGTAPWTVVQSSGSKLLTIGVTPYIWSEHQAGSVTQYYFPPCAHAAMAFRFWRGTMKYRFQVVASNFHKGRLQIQYDPYDSALNNFPAAFNRIVDISEQRDFTVEVGWGIPDNYGEMINPGTSSMPYVMSDVALPHPANTRSFNGQLSVWVLNDLTVPNSSVNNDIHINVFVSCGDDFEFQSPSETILDNFVFHNPSIEEFASEDDDKEKVQLIEQSGSDLIADDVPNSDEHGKPSITTPVTTVGNVDMNTSAIADVCFGERIVSFRSLVKRYSLHEIIPVSSLKSAGTGRTWEMTRRKTAFPVPRGKHAGSVYKTTGSASYWYVQNHFLNWLTVAYAGRRGGIRHKFVALPTVQGQSGFPATIQGIQSVIRESAVGLGEAVVYTDMGVQSSLSPSMIAALGKRFLSGLGGLAAQPISHNPVVEVEIPYATPFRFIPACQDSDKSGKDNTLRYTIAVAKYSLGGVWVCDYVAAADDFSFFFYMGPPPAYYAPSDPNPNTTD